MMRCITYGTEEIQKMQIQNGVQNPVNWMDQLKISNILRNSLPSVMTITALLLAHQQFQIFDGGKAENSQASRMERHVWNEFLLFFSINLLLPGMTQSIKNVFNYEIHP